ncbi:MAG: portal protein [Alphaproteobacteria bacterium]
MTKLSYEQICSKIKTEVEDAQNFVQNGLSAQRRKSIDYYLGKPLGNEVEGRSKVVSTDVSDTVEWILPNLLKMFASGSEVVRFQPVGVEDEAGAAQASDYINHIFNKDNNGFKVLYTWFKDALIQKNGFVKYWFEEKEEKKRETFKAIPEDVYALMLSDIDADKSLKFISSKEIMIKNADDIAAINAAGVDENIAVENSTILNAPYALYDITFEKTIKTSRVRIENVPPEEFLIDAEAKSIEEARFVAHSLELTRSDLLEQGYSKAVVEGIASDNNFSDENADKISLHECYLRIDIDGDGIDELRKITVAGTDFKILDNERVDEIPFCSLSPVMIPHQFFGLSVADQVMDIQMTKSSIMRQLLDNMYLTNNSRYAVMDGQVNLDDMMTSRPGGVVRVKSPDAVRPLATPVLGDQAFGMLEYMDSVRENRTGVTRYMQGLDANSLNKTASGISQIMTASQQRVDLIARVFSETGVKDLFRALLRLVTKYQDSERVIRLRNTWVPMQPSAWNPEMDVTVNVGLGTGDRNKELGHLGSILDIQKQAITLQGGVDGPLVTTENVYNTLRKIVENTGLKSVESYFTDPIVSRMRKEAERAEQGQMEGMFQEQEMVSPEQRYADDKVQIEREKAQLAREKFDLDRHKTLEELRLKEKEVEAKYDASRAKLAEKMRAAGLNDAA